jgi:hypothetical protein
MNARLVLILAALATGSFAGAEVVEEETWYSAEGNVVKTVTRTLTGPDARATPDWEPLWVLRERARAASQPVRYASPLRGYDGYYGGGYWSGVSLVGRHCSPAAGYNRGYRYYGSRSHGGAFRAGLRVGGGHAGWSAGYRGGGLSVLFTR